MADRILVTTEDLEHAVRSNAGLEAAGFQTTLASLDEARQALRREPPPPPAPPLTAWACWKPCSITPWSS